MKEFLEITAPKYKFGSYFRKDFSDYMLHKRFNYFDISLSKRNDDICIADSWMMNLLSEKLVAQGDYHKFLEDAHSFVAENEYIWDLTNEQLYYCLHKVRLSYLNASTVHRYKASLVRKALPLTLKNGDIFQIEHLEALLHDKGSVIIAVDDLLYTSESIEKALDFLESGKRVYIILKSESLTPIFTVREFEKLCLNSGIRSYYESEQLEIVLDYYDGRGFDFRKIQSHLDLQYAIEKNDVFLCGFGDDVFLSTHDLKIDAMIFTSPESIFSSSILSAYECDTMSLVYIPAGFNIFTHVSIVEAPEITFSQYAFLDKKYGEHVYKRSISSLKRLYPNFFINIHTDALCKDMELLEGSSDNLKRILLSQRNKFQTQIIEDSSTRKSFSVYHEHTGESNEQPDILPEWKNKTLINALLLSKAQNAEVLMVNDYGADSFRSYMRKKGLLEFPRYMCNFMFFTTPNIIDSYNRLRAERPREQIASNCNHIDFYRVRCEQIKQSFPLYNKACIAKDSDGKFSFFNFSLGAGSIFLDRFCMSWQEKDVNPSAASEIAIYTPQLSSESQYDSSDDFIMRVGSDRLNIVIVGDSIICIRQGDVLLPSVGVVVSISGDLRSSFEKYFTPIFSADGYFEAKQYALRISLAPPAALSLEKWERIDWAFGGGISLISNSICVFDEGESFKTHLKQEGWWCPLSMQTQESKVHDENEIHPRTALGSTKDDKFFVIVFSGRSASTRGVSYIEMCKLARLYINDISFMMAVDGGASSFLGFAANSTFIELSHPACTEAGGTGIVRRVNSILML